MLIQELITAVRTDREREMRSALRKRANLAHARRPVRRGMVARIVAMFRPSTRVARRSAVPTPAARIDRRPT